MIGKVINLIAVDWETTTQLLHKLHNDVIIPDTIIRYPSGRSSAEFRYEGRHFRVAFTENMVNDQPYMWVYDDGTTEPESVDKDRRIEMEL